MKKTTLPFSLTAASLLVFSSGCVLLQLIPTAQMPSRKQPPSIDKRAALAEEYGKKGNFADALLQWKIVSTKYPDNPLYKQYIDALEQLIETKIKLHLRLAKQAYTQKRFAVANTEFLKILALNPLHPAPLNYLRKIRQRHVWQNQLIKLAKLTAKKTARADHSTQPHQSRLTDRSLVDEQERYYLELGIELYHRRDFIGSIREIGKFLNSYPDDQDAMRFFAQAQLALAKNYQEQGDIQLALPHFEQWLVYTTEDIPSLKQDIINMRIKLAHEFYQKGRRAFRGDISRAIEYLQQSLYYRPQHEQARLLLNWAKKIKNRLDRINNEP